MNENVLNLSTIGQLLRQRRRLLVTLAALGAVLGGASVLLVPPVYESTTKVLLQGPRDKAEILTEAQLAMSLVVLDRTSAALHWDVSGTDLAAAVTAKVVDGNVIEIMTGAPSPTRARQLAEQVTEQYIGFSTEIVTNVAKATSDVLGKRQANLKASLEDTNSRITELQGRPDLVDPLNPQAAVTRAELDRLRSSRKDITDELDGIEARIGESDAQAAVGRAAVRVIEPAVEPTGAVPPTFVHLSAGGALLLVLLGTFGLVAARQADHRLRQRCDIAAAVGAPVLGTVDPPAGLSPAPLGAPTPTGVRAWLTWLLAAKAEQRIPARDPSLEHLRYRRALARLGELPAAPARLLVVMPAGDEPAWRAAVTLSVAAAATGRRVQVATGHQLLSQAVRVLAAADGASDLVVGPSPVPLPPHVAVLDLAQVPLARPTLLSRPPGSRSLLVVTSGMATAWELLGIAEAVRDAVCPLAGVLLVSHTEEEEMPADGWGGQPSPGVAGPASGERRSDEKSDVHV